MNKYLLPIVISGLFIITSTPAMALTEEYFATGEDIDNIINNDEISTLVQIEDKLHEFSIYRTLAGYFTNVQYLSTDENVGEMHVNAEFE